MVKDKAEEVVREFASLGGHDDLQTYRKWKATTLMRGLSAEPNRFLDLAQTGDKVSLTKKDKKKINGTIQAISGGQVIVDGKSIKISDLQTGSQKKFDRRLAYQEQVKYIKRQVTNYSGISTTYMDFLREKAIGEGMPTQYVGNAERLEREYKKAVDAYQKQYVSYMKMTGHVYKNGEWITQEQAELIAEEARRESIPVVTGSSGSSMTKEQIINARKRALANSGAGNSSKSNKNSFGSGIGRGSRSGFKSGSDKDDDDDDKSRASNWRD